MMACSYVHKEKNSELNLSLQPADAVLLRFQSPNEEQHNIGCALKK